MGLTYPALHSLLPLTLGEILAYPLQPSNNFQLPFSKRLLVQNSFFTKLSYFEAPYHNALNCHRVLQHLKPAWPTFTMATNAILGTYTDQLHPPPHYAAFSV